MELLTSFEGRIPRKGFWMGLLAILVITVVLGLGLQSVLPAGIVLSLGQIVVSAGIAFIWSAVLVKRLHDRGKPALPWLVIFLAPGVLMQVMSIFKIGYSSAELAGVQIMVPGTGAAAVMWLSMAVGLWMVVELGLLKGVPGDNAYGPDPLGGAAEPHAA